MLLAKDGSHIRQAQRGLGISVALRYDSRHRGREIGAQREEAAVPVEEPQDATVIDAAVAASDLERWRLQRYVAVRPECLEQELPDRVQLSRFGRQDVARTPREREPLVESRAKIVRRLSSMAGIEKASRPSGSWEAFDGTAVVFRVLGASHATKMHVMRVQM